MFSLFSSFCFISLVILSIVKIVDFYGAFYYRLVYAERIFENLTVALESKSIWICTAESQQLCMLKHSYINFSIEVLTVLSSQSEISHRTDFLVLIPNISKYNNDNFTALLSNPAFNLRYYDASQSTNDLFSTLHVKRSDSMDEIRFPSSSWSQQQTLVLNVITASDQLNRRTRTSHSNELRKVFHKFSSAIKSRTLPSWKINYVYTNNIGIAEHLQRVSIKPVGNISYLSARRALKYAQTSRKSPFQIRTEICHDCSVFNMIIYISPPQSIVVDPVEGNGSRLEMRRVSGIRLPNMDGSIIFVDSSTPVNKPLLLDLMLSQLRSFMNIPSSLFDNEQDSRRLVTGSSGHSSRDSRYSGLFVTRSEGNHFLLYRLKELHWKSIKMLGVLVRTGGYHNPLLLFMSLRSDYYAALRVILDTLQEIQYLVTKEAAICAGKASSPSPSRYSTTENGLHLLRDSLSGLTAEERCRLEDPLRVVEQLKVKIPVLYDQVRLLYQDSEGPASRLEFNMQEIFALFGPFWLPLTIPVYRILRSDLK